MQSNPIIVALDVASVAAAESLVSQLSSTVGAYKVGLELFNAVGLDIFRAIKEADPTARIFYDAKFHDIPNTVAGAVRASLTNGIWMVNVHASGGRAMMAAAVDAASKCDVKPLVIAVTVLTSLDDHDLNNDLGVSRSAAEQVVALAELSKAAGCDGVVCSPHEIELIKKACGRDFLVISPGVRPAGSSLGDQKRVMTPGEAVARGADFIVVGRPITGSVSPAESALAILAEIREATADL
jgi:orotidine-5'-phosphate decarboxylase